MVDTGRWLPGRRVLVDPSAIGDADWSRRGLPVSLTKDEIESAPEIDTDRPVSRQQEKSLREHYGWPIYWGAPGALGAAVGVAGVEPWPRAEEGGAGGTESAGDPSLRSAKEVEGYKVIAVDGDIGHVNDLIADDEAWIIRYLAIDTRSWLPGGKVIVPPNWTSTISWRERAIYVDVDREKVKQAPDYDPAQPVNRAYEKQLYDFYGRPAYWEKLVVI